MDAYTPALSRKDFNSFLGETFFYCVPIHLERWLSRQSLSRSEEHVLREYWFDALTRSPHGWNAKVSVSVLSERLGLHPATIKTANQSLRRKGLIQREETPRPTPSNISTTKLSPVKITRILLPADLIKTLENAPKRFPKNKAESPCTPSYLDQPAPSINLARNPQSMLAPNTNPADLPKSAKLNAEISSAKQRLQELGIRPGKTWLTAARGRFPEGSDPEQCKTAMQQYNLLVKERSKINNATTTMMPNVNTPSSHPLSDFVQHVSARKTLPRSAIRGELEPPRKLPAAILNYLEKGLGAIRGVSCRNQLAKEIAFSISAGVYRQGSPRHGINIALKLIRTNKWRTPIGMSVSAMKLTGEGGRHATH